MGPTVVLRSRSSRWLGAAMVVLAAAGVVSTLFAERDAVATYAAPLAVFALLGWAAFWHPHVQVSDGGVRVVNTLRTTDVPWPALQEVQGRYGLRLVTTYGPVQAWGAQAPTGAGRARGGESEAAVVVRERWEALREAGYLRDARLEHEAPPRRWHHATLGALAVLLAAILAGLLLG